MSNYKYSLDIGSIVNVPNNRKGVLKFIGHVGEKPGLFAGIELVDGAVGKNSGDYNGRAYFKVKVPGTGVFYSYDTIALCNNTSTSQSIAKRSSTGAVVNTSTTKTVKNNRLSLDSQAAMRVGPRRAFSSTLHTIDPVNSTNHSINVHNSAEKRSSFERRSAADRASMRTTPAASSLRNSELQSQINTLSKQQESLLHEKRLLATELSKYKAQLDDKVALLNEYKSSIEHELKPVIEDYKYQLQQKELKLVKVKQQADQQRDDLRDAISALEDQASENAELYTVEVDNMKAKVKEHEFVIEDLKAQIEVLNGKLQNTSNGDDRDHKVAALQQEVDAQTKTILTLKNQLKERELIIGSLNKSDAALKNKQEGQNDFSFADNASNNISDTELETLHRNFNEIKKDTDRLTKQIIEKDSLIQKLSDEITLLRNEKDLYNSLAEKNKELDGLYQKDTELLKSNQDQLETLRSGYESQIQTKNSEIEKLNEMLNDLSLLKEKRVESSENPEVEELKRKLKERDNEIETLKNSAQNFDDLSNEIDKLKHKNSVLVKKNDEIDSLTSQLNSQDSAELKIELGQKDREIAELKRNIDVVEQLNQQIVNLKSDNSSLMSHEEDLIRQYDDLRYRHSEIEDILSQKNKEIGALKASQEALEKENEQLKSENKLSEELRKEELAEKDRQIEELQAVLKKLESNSPGDTQHQRFKNLNNNNSVSSVDTSGSVFSPSFNKRFSNLSIDDHVDESHKSNEFNSRNQLKYSSTPAVVQGGLPIYKPSITVDASAGKVNWCGLCEREGHLSYECPFE